MAAEIIDEMPKVREAIRDFGGEKAVDELLERIREETPHFPRWFAPLPIAICYLEDTNERVLCIRFRGPGAHDNFVGGVWHPGAPDGTLDSFLRHISGFVREISRAEAFALTGGNP